MSMLSRRELLESLMCAGAGAALVPWVDLPDLRAWDGTGTGGKLVEILPFVGEGDSAVGRKTGEGLDGRLALDLTDLAADSLITPNDRFYVRTDPGDGLKPADQWTLRVTGLVKRSLELSLADLESDVRWQGVHLLECSGNSGGRHFGLISAAEWSGVSIDALLERARPLGPSDYVLVRGRDPQSGSGPATPAEASWIFSREDLRRAFLATRMNGQPLPPDHGRPLRLVVPGWYGCACIKWVEEISVVSEDTPATEQMRDYAGRTHQRGVPEKAAEYQPAVIDLAAMPVRVEKWSVEGETRYKVVGIAWGADRPTDALEISFGNEEEYVPVSRQIDKENPAWSLWTHPWRPREPGIYSIRLRVNDQSVRTRRLDWGYYTRRVRVPE